MRTFPSGATRDDDQEKLRYDGFLCPFVLKRYAEYMHRHRIQVDGSLRAPDNWKNGFGEGVCFQSLTRHFMELWQIQNGGEGDEEETLCAIMFNSMAMLRERLKNLPSDPIPPDSRLGSSYDNLTGKPFVIMPTVLSPLHSEALNGSRGEFVKAVAEDLKQAENTFYRELAQEVYGPGNEKALQAKNDLDAERFENGTAYDEDIPF